MGYEKNFAIPAVIDLMEQALPADEGERDRLRRELYTIVLPQYQHLLKNSFQQVHFHLADGTSFLCMHLPALYGDQFSNPRPSVTLVNSTNKPVAGYEMGRHMQAYRFVFPLFTADQYLGSVDIGLPFSTLLHNLMANFPAEYRFIADKQMAMRHLDAATLRDHFTTTDFSSDFLSEITEQEAIDNHTHPNGQGHIDQIQIARINQALHNQFTRHLSTFQTVSLPLFQDSRAFLVHLLPINDISGEAAGYLMVYEQSTTLLAMKWRFLLGYILVTIFSLLLIVFHAIYTGKLLNRLILQQALQQELNESHAELDQIFNSAADGMRLIDRKGVIIRANKTFADLVHLPIDQIIGKKCHQILSGANCHTDNCPLHLIGNGAERTEYESERIKPDGTTLHCLVVAQPFYNLKGELQEIIEDFRDISERKQLEQQLQALSITDELTGLCNRRGFMTLAQQQLDYVKRAGGECFLIFADLDNMKWVNDHLGHEAGDAALVATAGLLRKTVREADIVGRMGGDEFAVLLTSVSSTDSEAILLARLELALAETNKGLPPEQQLAISFGVVLNLEENSLDELLAQADARMYAAKKRKRQRPDERAAA